MVVYAGDPPYAADLNRVGELLESAGVANSTAVTPLTSTANQEIVVASLNYEFVTGYAYEIVAKARLQIAGGTSPFVASVKIRRASAAGTLIADPGGTAMVTTNFLAIERSVIVKRTGATTTQTIVSTASFSSTGSPTSVDLEASADAPATLTIRPIGLASNFATFREIATS